jgi:hypothetical protein
MYVFGGYSGVSYLNDTNSLNLSTLAWTDIATTGSAPTVRYGHVSVLDTGNRMYVYGGSSDGANTTFSDVNRLDLTTATWSGTLSCTGTSPPGNTGRVWSSAVIYNNNMYVFGGWIGTDSRNDVYKLDLSTLVWSQITTTGTPPAKRYGQSSIIDTSFNMYVFGGWGAARYNDVYKLDLSTLVWSQITTTGTPPAIRYFHSAIYSNDNKMYVFGGQEGGTFYRDVNCLDLTTLAWTQPVISGIPPIERGQHSALLSDASNMYIYAGNYGDVYDDVHKLGA